MRITRFDPESDLIIVKARVWGPRGKMPASLAVDTGSAHTIVAASLIDTLGYSPQQGEAITTVRTAGLAALCPKQPAASLARRAHASPDGC